MSPPDPVVHVIDDEGPARGALALLLTHAGLRVRSYSSPGEFLAAAPVPATGCIVAEMGMPQLGGLELMIRLLAFAQPVIMVTGLGDVPLAVEAMKLGAADFLVRPFEEATMIAAVRQALGAARASADSKADTRAARMAVLTLSARETDVLVGLVEGKTNKMIARDLGISARTIEEYRANVMTKLGAGSLSALLLVALRAGIGP